MTAESIHGASTLCFSFDPAVTCCFTGHRVLPKGQRQTIETALCAEIDALVAQGYTDFVAGGALGFDTLAALCVVRKRALLGSVRPIRLHLFLPCPEQSDNWDESDRLLYRRILAAADTGRYVSPHYTRSCMLDRNRAMVDVSSVLIAYLTRDTGGSAYTVRYAKQTGKVVTFVGEHFGV